ncbi:MAG: DUF6273 domain-containing protein [Clostridiales bacterium]|jgi:hypothetical protein|nr:DUF6273 domain-containing protein [Clostridiales bacterium]
MLNQKILSMLDNMQKEYPEALTCTKRFKALANDILQNEYVALVRWLSIALFERDALLLLQKELECGENYTRYRLTAKLINEGARHDLAAEVIGYLAVLAGYDEEIIIESPAIPFSDSDSTPKVIKFNDAFSFGGYEWKVLEAQSDKLLLISEGIIIRRAYNDTDTEVTWETCSLREYLNTEFFNLFNQTDKERIVPSEIINSDNPWYKTVGGNIVTDKIFLLSLDEVVKHFGDSGQLRNRKQGQMFINDQKGNHSRIAYDNDIAACWWLRSPGHNNYNAATIFGNGFISPDGFGVDSVEGGVRPALWLMY